MQIRYRLQHFVSGLDGLAVELEGSLRLDQRDEFLDGIDVGAFEKALHDGTGAVVARVGVDGRAGGVGGDVDRCHQEVPGPGD